jgi:hypothetical protein
MYKSALFNKRAVFSGEDQKNLDSFLEYAKEASHIAPQYQQRYDQLLQKLNETQKLYRSTLGRCVYCGSKRLQQGEALCAECSELFHYTYKEEKKKIQDIINKVFGLDSASQFNEEFSGKSKKEPILNLTPEDKEFFKQLRIQSSLRFSPDEIRKASLLAGLSLYGLPDRKDRVAYDWAAKFNIDLSQYQLQRGSGLLWSPEIRTMTAAKAYGIGGGTGEGMTWGESYIDTFSYVFFPSTGKGLDAADTVRVNSSRLREKDGKVYCAGSEGILILTFPAKKGSLPQSDDQVLPQTSAPLGAAPVLGGPVNHPEPPNNNAMREQIETVEEMEIGKPIEQKEKEVALKKEIQIDKAGPAKTIVINIAKMRGTKKANGRLHPFAKEDWYGWAGAERFSDGSEPLIGDFEDRTVIVDANGVGLYIGDDVFTQNGTSFMYRAKGESKEHLIKLAEQVLVAGDLDDEILERMGFYPI